MIFELEFTEAARLRDAQSVRSRLALRERLECKNFQWYLKEVWPENFFPAPDRFFGKVKCAFVICYVPDVLEQVSGTDSGIYEQVMHKGTKQCLERPQGSGSSQTVGNIKLVPCIVQWFDAKLWVGTWNSTHRDGRTNSGFLMGDESICLDHIDGEGRAMACSGLSRQLWYHNQRTNAVVHVDSGRCLSIAKHPEPSGVSVHDCDASADQQWVFESVAWK